METRQRELESWVAFKVSGDLGYTYIRLYADAPDWVKHLAVNRYGKGTVFLPPETRRAASSMLPTL